MLLTGIFIASLCLGTGDEIPLPSGVIPMAEPLRYRSPRSFDDTLDYYRRLYKNKNTVRWLHIINRPGIKAVHLENLEKHDTWEGINIYEHQGETRLFVLKGK